MAKLKIVEPGWAGYTGLLGRVDFVDGVSVEDVSLREAQALGGIVRIENVDTGQDVSLSQYMVDSRKAGVGAPREEPKAPIEVKAVVAEPEAPVVPATTYTREQLELLADTGGIKALREIAEPLGLKAAGIQDLIKKVLDHQAPQSDVRLADAPTQEEGTETISVNTFEFVDAEIISEPAMSDKASVWAVKGTKVVRTEASLAEPEKGSVWAVRGTVTETAPATETTPATYEIEGTVENVGVVTVHPTTGARGSVWAVRP